jgi:homoserine kinase type II
VLQTIQKTAEVVRALLGQAERWAVPIQPCIRDIHREHVLFQDECVSGLIDFGAMRCDSCAGDIARLLGSLAGDDRALWTVGLDAYQHVRPLAEAECRLVNVFDASGVLLSGINWLEWVFIDGRAFENRSAVISRFEEIAARLTVLANQGMPIIV